ncbi:hypothetical protein HSBAA_43250 [Vreelandella sulfidaeris]|uniref:RapA2 cadherin-like domain-containing protein n=1 Tax=Vreelandella sulfidaeris TaxID=115553 RepID=A0A455UFH3_9GAMM|nr:hypothetical protein HSBAA_43250 [Halomonas sulfidaeris]
MIGIGSNVSDEYLEHIQVQEGKEPLIVTDESQLEQTLTNTAHVSVKGDVSDNVKGGDGVISFDSITVYGTTYTADGNNGTKAFPSGGISLDGQGVLIFDFGTGEYSYSATGREFNADTQKQFIVTASDTDGDTVNFDVILDINADTKPTASDEQAITTDGSLEGNLLDNVDFGSDGKGASGGLKSLKVGDTSHTPDVDGNIVINNVLGGTLTVNPNGEYSLSGAALASPRFRSWQKTLMAMRSL